MSNYGVLRSTRLPSGAEWTIFKFSDLVQCFERCSDCFDRTMLLWGARTLGPSSRSAPLMSAARTPHSLYGVRSLGAGSEVGSGVREAAPGGEMRQLGRVARDGRWRLEPRR